MKTLLNKNNWTLTIDEDIKELSQDQLFEVAKLINRHFVVIFKNQNLTIEDELRITSTIGKVKLDHGKDEKQEKAISLQPGVLRVTGEKNEDGNIGLFGHNEVLDWHTHHTSSKFRYPFVWMYSIKGSKGSKTSWINQELSYKDLSNEMKDKLENIKYVSGNEYGRFSDMKIGHKGLHKENPMKIVYKNKEDKKGLYFPFLQVFDIVEGATKEEWTELYNFLIKHCTQEKFIYHHNWQDNDLVISEQWLSIHKRWPFDNMKDRLLHRIAFDDSKAYE